MKPSAKPLWFKSMATGLFITISSGLFITGFIYKDTWLGVHIYFVPSMSMHPTLKPGEFILLDAWAYQEINPQLDDVVVFRQRSTDKESGHWLVKRISNWPDGKLNHLEDWYVLGDNRSNSQDSRYFGEVQQEQIIGKVRLVLVGIDKHNQLQSDSYLKRI